MKILLDKIVVGERQRLDLGDIEELADSLKECGQIHNIGVDENNKLIWGRRRLEAARFLGWTELDATQRHGLTEAMEQRIELEEDVKRKDRTWQEKCLATKKLFHILSREKRALGEEWTLRNMASFTGIGKSSIGYMLQVGDALSAVPKDDAVWSCENYVDAIKQLLGRKEAEVQAEIERRRQKLVVADVPTDQSKPSAVQVLDTTEPAEPNKVFIHGFPIVYSEIPPDEVWGCAHLIMAYNPSPRVIQNIALDLRETGFAVLWFDVLPTDWGNLLFLHKLHEQPHRLIWNKNIIVDSKWPFCPNYAYGIVLSKNMPDHCQQPRPSVVTCNPGDNKNMLPAAVVDFTVSILQEGLAVTCLPGVPVVAVAESGRIPIWYETDKERFDANVVGLKAHYEQIIPNVTFEIRSS